MYKNSLDKWVSRFEMSHSILLFFSVIIMCFIKLLTLWPSVKSRKTWLYTLSSLAVICFNAFQLLTCSNTPLRMRKKKRIAEVNGVKTVCLLLHQEKPGSTFRAYVYQLTSLPHYGSWVVLRLSSTAVSGSIWVNLGHFFIYLLQLLLLHWGKKSLIPWHVKQLQHQQKTL